MNRRQIVDSDDEAEELLPKPPTTKSGSSKNNLQHRNQSSTVSENDLNIADGESLEETKQDHATSTRTEVRDLIRLLHMGADSDT